MPDDDAPDPAPSDQPPSDQPPPDLSNLINADPRIISTVHRDQTPGDYIQFDPRIASETDLSRDEGPSPLGTADS
jgi:hypothetical protein